MSQNAAALSDEALVDSKPLKSSSEPDALNAPASKPATTFQPVTFTPITNDATAPSTTKEPVVAEPTLGAPTTTEQTKPTVTTGTETTTTEAKSGAPVATTESSASYYGCYHNPCNGSHHCVHLGPGHRSNQ
jgi:hypothetical protein